MLLEAVLKSQACVTPAGFTGSCVSTDLLAVQLRETMSHTWGSSFSPRDWLHIPSTGFTVPSARAPEMAGINTREH